MTRVQCSNIAARQRGKSPAWPANSQHWANIMEAFGDESYVGIKEMTMDMKVKLRGESDVHVMINNKAGSNNLNN